MTSLVVRLFSGSHCGAEIELTPGTWVFGTDDSCDIILADSALARRHAALTVRDEGEEPGVSAEALDGDVRGLDENAGAASELAALTPYRMGPVIFAWTKSPVGESDWNGVMDLLRAGGAAPQAEAEPQPAVPGEGAASEASAEPEQASGPESESEPGNPEADDPDAGGEEDVRAARRRLGLVLAAALVILVAGLFLIFRVTSGTASAPQDEIRGMLARSGFGNLSVTTSAPGRFLVSGAVPDDIQRGRLIRLAEMLPYPATIKVSVESDLVGALKSAFQSRGFWPDVAFRESRKGRRVLSVRAYIRDGQTERRLFQEAAQAVPGLSPAAGGPEIERVILHEDDLQALVERTIPPDILAVARLRYLPGRVEVHLPLTAERERVLGEAVSRLRSEAGVPLAVDILREEERPAAAPAPQTQTAAEPPPAAPAYENTGPAFRVVSTSLGVLRFVRLSSGERVFEGGRLPGGYTLEKIYADRLILLKGGLRSAYPLRVRK